MPHPPALLGSLTRKLRQETGAGDSSLCLQSSWTVEAEQFISNRTGCERCLRTATRQDRSQHAFLQVRPAKNPSEKDTARPSYGPNPGPLVDMLYHHRSGLQDRASPCNTFVAAISFRCQEARPRHDGQADLQHLCCSYFISVTSPVTARPAIAPCNTSVAAISFRCRVVHVAPRRLQIPCNTSVAAISFR